MPFEMPIKCPITYSTTGFVSVAGVDVEAAVVEPAKGCVEALKLV